MRDVLPRETAQDLAANRSVVSLMCTGTATAARDDGHRHAMDTRRDIKPIFPSLTSQRGAPLGFTCQAAPTPLGRGARVAAPQQQQADCVLNRAASEVPEDVLSCGDAEGAASCRSAPVSAARISRKFWSAGDYEAAGSGKPAQPPRSTPTIPRIALYIRIFACELSAGYLHDSCLPSLLPS